MELIGVVLGVVIVIVCGSLYAHRMWQIVCLERSKTKEDHRNLQAHADMVVQQSQEIMRLRGDIAFYRECLDKMASAVARHSGEPRPVAAAYIPASSPVYMGSDGKYYPSAAHLKKVDEEIRSVSEKQADAIEKMGEIVNSVEKRLDAHQNPPKLFIPNMDGKYHPSIPIPSADDNSCCPDTDCLHSARARENFGIATAFDDPEAERRYREYLDS